MVWLQSGQFVVIGQLMEFGQLIAAAQRWWPCRPQYERHAERSEHTHTHDISIHLGRGHRRRLQGRGATQKEGEYMANITLEIRFRAPAMPLWQAVRRKCRKFHCRLPSVDPNCLPFDWLDRIAYEAFVCSEYSAKRQIFACATSHAHTHACKITHLCVGKFFVVQVEHLIKLLHFPFVVAFVATFAFTQSLGNVNILSLMSHAIINRLWSLRASAVVSRLPTHTRRHTYILLAYLYCSIIARRFRIIITEATN